LKITKLFFNKSFKKNDEVQPTETGGAHFSKSKWLVLGRKKVNKRPKSILREGYSCHFLKKFLERTRLKESWRNFMLF
jgi:hypothetical protein